MAGGAERGGRSWRRSGVWRRGRRCVAGQRLSSAVSPRREAGGGAAVECGGGAGGATQWRGRRRIVGRRLSQAVDGGEESELGFGGCWRPVSPLSSATLKLPGERRWAGLADRRSKARRGGARGDRSRVNDVEIPSPTVQQANTTAQEKIRQLLGRPTEEKALASLLPPFLASTRSHG